MSLLAPIEHCLCLSRCRSVYWSYCSSKVSCQQRTLHTRCLVTWSYCHIPGNVEVRPSKGLDNSQWETNGPSM